MNKTTKNKADKVALDSGSDGAVPSSEDKFGVERLRKSLEVTPATDLKYMSYASEAVLQQAPGLHRVLLWGICACVLVLIIWAYFAEVDEFTRSEGRIVPSSDIQIVQNLEGGILANIYVAEGDTVSQGQALLQIDDTLASSSFRERSLQGRQLLSKMVRLRAESNGSSFDAELARVEKDQVAAELISVERDLYNSRVQEFATKLDALQQKVEQKKQELSSVRLNRTSLAESYSLLERELQITRPLVQKGALSPVELLRLERQLNDLKGDLGRARLAIPQLQAEHREASKHVESYQQNFVSESRRELNEVSSELGRLEEGNQAYSDRVDRTVVKSPVRGTVKQLKVKTLGGVIQPGMDLVEIVPMDDSLLVDAKVLPADIAFIHPDQAAMVKFTAYDFAIHGGLSARVTQISPDTIKDEQKDVSYYQVRLKTDGGMLGSEQEPLPIIPGMTVQVDILTGKKTILDYILKPILKTKQLAFREK